MNKIVVIYQSKYGTTKQYATWIANELKADLIEKSRVKPKQLDSYDLIVYGGGLYAGGISGVELIIKNPCKCSVIFTVGLANPDTTDYSDILEKNFNEHFLENIQIFHLRGGIDYKKLSFVHRSMMLMLKKFMLDKKLPEGRTEDEEVMLETYGGKVDFTDKSAIKPIVDYVRGICTDI